MMNQLEPSKRSSLFQDTARANKSFRLSHDDLFELMNTLLKISRRIVPSVPVYAGTGHLSEARRLLREISSYPAQVHLYGLPDVVLMQSPNLNTHKLSFGDWLHKERFFLVSAPTWHLFLGATIDETGASCILTQSPEMIEAAFDGLGETPDRLSGYSLRHELTAELLWYMAVSFSTIQQIAEHIGELGMPLGFAWLLRQKPAVQRWAFVAKAISGMLQTKSLAIYQLDAVERLLRPLVGGDENIHLNQDRVLTRAAFSNQIIQIVENGLHVLTMPITEAGQVWGVLETRRTQATSDDLIDRLSLLIEIVRLSLRDDVVSLPPATYTEAPKTIKQQQASPVYDTPTYIQDNPIQDEGPAEMTVQYILPTMGEEDPYWPDLADFEQAYFTLDALEEEKEDLFLNDSDSDVFEVFTLEAVQNQESEAFLESKSDIFEMFSLETYPADDTPLDADDWPELSLNASQDIPQRGLDDSPLDVLAALSPELSTITTENTMIDDLDEWVDVLEANPLPEDQNNDAFARMLLDQQREYTGMIQAAMLDADTTLEMDTDELFHEDWQFDSTMIDDEYAAEDDSEPLITQEMPYDNPATADYDPYTAYSASDVQQQELETLRAKFTELKQQLEDEHHQFAVLQAQLEETQWAVEELEAARQQIMTLEQQIADAQAELAVMQALYEKVADYEAQIVQLEAQMGASHARIAQMEAAYERAAQAEAELALADEKYRELEDALQASQYRINDLETLVENTRILGLELEAAHTKMAQYEQRLADEQAHRSSIESERNTLVAQLALAQQTGINGQQTIGTGALVNGIGLFISRLRERMSRMKKSQRGMTVTDNHMLEQVIMETQTASEILTQITQNTSSAGSQPDTLANIIADVTAALKKSTEQYAVQLGVTAHAGAGEISLVREPMLRALYNLFFGIIHLAETHSVVEVEISREADHLRITAVFNLDARWVNYIDSFMEHFHQGIPQRSGLAFARSVIQYWGGSLTHHVEPTRRTTIQVILPG